MPRGSAANRSHTAILPVFPFITLSLIIPFESRLTAILDPGSRGSYAILLAYHLLASAMRSPRFDASIPFFRSKSVWATMESNEYPKGASTEALIFFLKSCMSSITRGSPGIESSIKTGRYPFIFTPPGSRVTSRIPAHLP